MFGRSFLRKGEITLGFKATRNSYALALLFALVSGSGSNVFAYDSTQVLPDKINSPMVRMGMISGIGQRYTSDGSLMTLSDYNSIDFDAKQLMKFEPRVQQLVNVLNQFGQQELGTSLTLGTLRIYTEPEVRYLAPLHAYGITKKWTMAVGLPIVTYKNKMSMGQTGSNLAEIRAMTGGISADLDAAFNELNVGLVASAEKELASKGYKPLTDRDETIIGDLQIASLYQIYSKKKTSVMLRTVLNLPTGPGDDPDDLADLGAFGYTSVDQMVIGNYQLLPRLRLSAKGGVRLHLPDQVTKRVPRDSEDTLPDASTKESVRRKAGDSLMASGGASFQLAKRWSVGGAYDIQVKGNDLYSGDRGSNYALLSRDTNAEVHRTRVGISYDTVQAYLSKEAMIPSMISYEFSDTVRGFNVERQTIHELWLTLFF